MVAEVVAVVVGASQSAYNSLWQLRADSWCSLEESTGQLALAATQGRPVGPLVETITELLNVLGPIERFWAFPGVRSFGVMRRLFAGGKYDRFAAVVSGINRALGADTGHTSQAFDSVGQEDALDAQEAEPDRSDRPYFEVLVVEDLTEQAERALREELHRWRRPDDPFEYEIVVVPSF